MCRLRYIALEILQGCSFNYVWVRATTLRVRMSMFQKIEIDQK